MVLPNVLISKHEMTAHVNVQVVALMQHKTKSFCERLPKFLKRITCNSNSCANFYI